MATKAGRGKREESRKSLGVCRGMTFAFRQFLHPIIFDGFLLEGVGTPLLPLAGVGVVAAFEGFGVIIFRVFEVGTAVGVPIFLRDNGTRSLCRQ